MYRNILFEEMLKFNNKYTRLEIYSGITERCTRFSSNYAFLKHEVAYCSRQARYLIAVLGLRNPIGRSEIVIDVWSLDEDPELVYHGVVRGARRESTGGLRRRIRYQPELSTNGLNILIIVGITHYTVSIFKSILQSVTPKAET